MPLFNQNLVITGKSWNVSTRAKLATLSVASVIDIITLGGYAAKADCPPMTYQRVAAAPTLPSRAWIQSADGAYWQIVGDLGVSLKQLGGVGDDATLNNAAIADWFTLGKTFPLILDVGIFRWNTPIVMDHNTIIDGFNTRQSNDNSDYNVPGPVSSLRYVGLVGDAITVNTGAASGNYRVRSVWRNIQVIGASITPGGATSGSNIVFNGAGLNARGCFPYLENVSSTEAREHGIAINGTAYGFTLTNCTANRNGYNGLHVSFGAEPIGEMYLEQIRCFQNGTLAASRADNNAAGIYLNTGGGSVNADNLSGSESYGVGIILSNINGALRKVQAESNGGTKQIAFINNCYNVTCAAFSIQPGANYTGECLNIEAGCTNISVTGIFFGDSLGVGGLDVFCAGSGCTVEAIRSPHTITVSNTGRGNFFTQWGNAGQNVYNPVLELALNANANDVTGDGTNYTILFNEQRSVGFTYNSGTGIATVIDRGNYQFNIVVTYENISATHTRGSLELITSQGNKVERLGSLFAQMDDTGSISKSMSVEMYLNEGDTFYLRTSVGQGGGSKTIDLAGTLATRMEVIRIN